MADTKISALTALAAADVALATDVLPIVDTSVTTTKKITVDDLGIALSLYKSGSLTRDMTVASGNVAYTGVGFKPKAIIFIAGDPTTAANNASVGFDDGATPASLANLNVVGAGQFFTPAFSVYLLQAGSTLQTAVVLSFDADGFTLTWTKTGSPTGTMTVRYLALR